MPSSTPPFMEIGQIHLDGDGRTTLVGLTVHYGRSTAHIQILPADPLDHPASDEEVRTELQALAAAIAQALEQPSSRISWSPQIRNRDR